MKMQTIFICNPRLDNLDNEPAQPRSRHSGNPFKLAQKPPNTRQRTNKFMQSIALESCQ